MPRFPPEPSVSLTGLMFSASRRTARHAHRNSILIPVVAVVAGGIAATIAGTAVAVDPFGVRPTLADAREQYVAENAQVFRLATKTDPTAVAADPSMVRDGYAATPGPETFIAGGTNHDWAKLVLVYAGFPVTESNVTVMLRWMRQENGPDSWYTRNNPLNIGDGGFASYSTLQEAAQVVANALNNYSGYSEIRAGFAASADPATIEYAIWASPWAGGHYAWGGHWHYTPVEVVPGPASSWGR